LVAFATNATHGHVMDGKNSNVYDEEVISCK
jgi:hypothetical protein